MVRVKRTVEVMRIQLAVFLVAGVLAGIVTAYVLTPRAVSPGSVPVGILVAPSPSNPVPVAVVRQPGVQFKFPDGSSLVWTTGVGGSVYFTNANALVPLWRLLQGPTWQQVFTPHNVYWKGPLDSQPPTARMNYSWSADTFDFRRPLPPIDFKDYKK